MKLTNKEKPTDAQIQAIIGMAIGEYLRPTVEGAVEEVLDSKNIKADFEAIRRLVANQQIVHGDTVQLQAIYEICNERLT